MLSWFLCTKFLLQIPCCFVFVFLIGRVPLTHPVLESIWPREFLLHIPCWLNIYVGSLSYTPRCGFNFISWLSLTHLKLASFLTGEFLLHIPCWLHFYLWSFSYTSRDGFIFIRWVSSTYPLLTIFMWGVYLAHPMLASFSNLGSFSDTSLAVFIFSCGIASHAASFLSGEFLLHIQGCFHFYLGNLS